MLSPAMTQRSLAFGDRAGASGAGAAAANVEIQARNANRRGKRTFMVGLLNDADSAEIILIGKNRTTAWAASSYPIEGHGLEKDQWQQAVEMSRGPAFVPTALRRSGALPSSRLRSSHATSPPTHLPRMC